MIKATVDRLDRIKLRMRAAELDLRWWEVAAKAHMSGPKLSEIRNGAVRASDVAIAKLERALKLDPGSLLLSGRAPAAETAASSASPTT